MHLAEVEGTPELLMKLALGKIEACPYDDEARFRTEPNDG